MRAPLGVAVIGLGVGARHLAAYARAGCRVRAVCDHDRVRAQEAARPHGARAVTDAMEAIALPGVEAVSIASYDADHFAQVRAALMLGRHVFVEKPLCTRPAEVEALAAVLAAAPVPPVLASNLVLRAAPFFAHLRAEVAAGALGVPYAVDGEYLYGRLPKLTDGWRGRHADYSPFLGGAVHLVDLMMWITGQRPVAVVAAGGDLCARGSGFTGDDFTAATFTFASGMVGRVTANFGSVTRHHHHLRLYGTEGTAISDDVGPRRHRRRDPGDPPEHAPLAALPADKGALVASFVDACLGRPSPLPGAAHELAVVAACCAADRSRREGRWVEIPYPDAPAALKSPAALPIAAAHPGPARP
ncbi:MAG TPA: Gfo/Idh/MocA family oxidoreductase [Miltoncostaeaceae bacterium]|nr:Gfo/Idh/MocA family oxidoreductase [Miltoncostaeaceae bacterium]